MKTVGIIMECNPFHEGHKYILDYARKVSKADAVIVVLSGAFVQRGAPAVYDYATRTKAVLEAGADVVIEMPTRFVLSSAEGFARSGVSLLAATGIVDELLFGMESEFTTRNVETDSHDLSAVKSTLVVEQLQAMADFLTEEPELYQTELKKRLKDGMSFPAARAEVIKEHYPDLNSALLDSPNNILAIEYTKAIKQLGLEIKIHPIHRAPGISAHKIRKTMESEAQSGLYMDDFSKLFQYKWQNQNLHQLEITDTEFSKELQQRLHNHITYNAALRECIDLCKTKQYTYSRISRCFFRFILGLNALKHSAYAPYLRILGFQKENSNVLKAIKENTKISVLQKLTKDQNSLSPEQYTILSEDLYAHEVYRMIWEQKYPDCQLKNDFTQGIIIT